MTLLDTAAPLYAIADIRAIEQAAAQTLPQGTLMQRAGQAAASAALKLLHAQEDADGRGHMRVLVLAGPGDNGGDALEAAAHLPPAAPTCSSGWRPRRKPPRPSASRR